MLIVITLALLLVFSVYPMVIILSFNNKADKDNLDLKQERQFKIKMVISGIGLGLAISVPFLNGEDLIPFIYISFFWCIVFTLGLAKIASRTISTIKKINTGHRNT